MREVQEETGLSIRVVRLVGVYSVPTPDRLISYPEGLTHSVDIVLEGVPLDGVLMHSEESEAVGFFEPTALPDMLHPAAREVLEDFARGVSGHVD